MKLHINKEIKKLLKERQDYFGKDEKISQIGFSSQFYCK